ncbi:uracil phosphoribosyltransferase [Sulfoacidibacillus thermotolerans]|uniref:Uracil phosphoribosyltransferase n=1 Tax=Sulfoacidibacillus thermotolerans TaxID=1765684 RepID=A0A2U3D9M2_SULT2|nr:uracil phosphoribosyltransferase [Sulfoacidibacillus thermotolerans]PWI57971.1 uracil phosphoribosyltransferase [Sulfoacidibacillus thermotolerans]
MKPIREINHPLALEKIGRLREQATDVPTFRRLVQELSLLLAIECTDDLKTESVTVQTPIAQATVVRSKEEVTLIPILRAGLGMMEGMLQWIPTAKVGHLGMYRDPETLLPVEYYANTPAGMSESVVIVLDPMLATGGSATAALDLLKSRGARRIKLASILAAPEGIAKVQSNHPDVQIYAVVVDQGLNDHGYIVPGLGDAGDRIFGTL